MKPFFWIALYYGDVKRSKVDCVLLFLLASLACSVSFLLRIVLQEQIAFKQ